MDKEKKETIQKIEQLQSEIARLQAEIESATLTMRQASELVGITTWGMHKLIVRIGLTPIQHKPMILFLKTDIDNLLKIPKYGAEAKKLREMQKAKREIK